jgi:hypothetical protein
MEVDDVISYHEVVTAEKVSLQKGMNYDVGKGYSVFLMSLRENGPRALARSSKEPHNFFAAA